MTSTPNAKIKLVNVTLIFQRSPPRFQSTANALASLEFSKEAIS
jgi:hypothetical protein